MAKFGTRQVATILALAALLNGKSEVNAGKGGANNNVKSELNVGKDGANNNWKSKVHLKTKILDPLPYHNDDLCNLRSGPFSMGCLFTTELSHFKVKKAMAERIVKGFGKYLFQNIGEIEVIEFDENKFQQESNFVIKRTMLSLHDKMILYNPYFFDSDMVDIVHNGYIEVPRRKINDNTLSWFNDSVEVYDLGKCGNFDVYDHIDCKKVREISLKSIKVDPKVDIAYSDFMMRWVASCNKLSEDIAYNDSMKEWRAKLSKNISYEDFMKGWRAYWSKLSRDIAHKDFIRKWRACRSKSLKENKLNDMSTTLEYEKEIESKVIEFTKWEYDIRHCELFNNAAFFVDYDGNTLSATLVKVNKDGSITVKKKTNPSTTDLEFKLKNQEM